VTSNAREEHPEGITVYNVEVEGTHTYFVRAAGSDAEPIWVHNARYGVTDIYPTLPEYNGGRSTGVFVGEDFNRMITSGSDGGPGSGLIDILPDLSDDAEIAALHLEGHSAAIMRENGLSEGTVFINFFRPDRQPGPCGYCTNGVPELLESGSRLWVVYPTSNGTGVGYFVGGKPGFNVIGG
jgi:hypothetical protein